MNDQAGTCCGHPACTRATLDPAFLYTPVGLGTHFRFVFDHLAFCAALMFVNPSALIFRGFLSRTVPLAGREIRCLLQRPRSSQRTPINCSFRAGPYGLRARNLLAQQPEPSYSNKCQKNVRVLSFLKGSFGSP
jgi:hypothetical protein